jgi:hypothetical protein
MRPVGYLLAFALVGLGVGLASPSLADTNDLPPYVPDPNSPEVITSTGDTFYDTQVYGDQLYDVVDSAGQPTGGTFDVYELQFKDVLGFTEDAYKVTSDVSGTDDPPVGSEVDLFSGYGFENVYTDIGGTITDDVNTPLGDFSIPSILADNIVPLDLQYLDPATAATSLDPSLLTTSLDPSLLTDLLSAF